MKKFLLMIAVAILWAGCSAEKSESKADNVSAPMSKIKERKLQLPPEQWWIVVREDTGTASYL